MARPSREVTRGGVRGREIWVAPKEGYTRFVPHHYEKDDDSPRRRSTKRR